MSKDKSDKPTPSLFWEPENLRFTLFHKEETLEQTWWKDLFDTTPDDSQTKKLLHKEESKFENGKLLLLLQLGRIDWQYIIDIEKDMESVDKSMLTLGEFSTSLDLFFEHINRWFERETCPSAIRLAFGTVLLKRVENLQAGYQKIAECLPNVTLDPEHSRDFMYRINRPRESKTGLVGLKINRLSTWSVAGLIRVQSAIPLGVGLVQHFQSPERFACRLELDINTAPEYQTGFLREQLSKVFQELVDLGKEIAQEGDIP